VFGGGDVAVDEGVVRAAVRRGPGVEQRVEELDLDTAPLGDPRPADQPEGGVELLLPPGRTPGRPQDRARHFGDVLRQAAEDGDVFGHEPQQVRVLEEPSERAADLVPEPRAGGGEALPRQLRVVGQ
jgi:hypothetical protein